jgi:hypothetical protein
MLLNANGMAVPLRHNTCHPCLFLDGAKADMPYVRFIRNISRNPSIGADNFSIDCRIHLISKRNTHQRNASRMRTMSVPVIWKSERGSTISLTDWRRSGDWETWGVLSMTATIVVAIRASYDPGWF